MDRLERFKGEVNDKKVWKQNEVFDAIGNDEIDNFFDNYKQFDEFLVVRDKSTLVYSGHILLDGGVSGKFHSDFYESFWNSIEGIVGEDMFSRMLVFFEGKDYLLSTRSKMNDGDPFLDDDFQTIVLGNNTVAQFIERRDDSNNVEFHYIVYPNRIFSFINELCKEHNI